jgi:hypothetical protein
MAMATDKLSMFWKYNFSEFQVVLRYNLKPTNFKTNVVKQIRNMAVNTWTNATREK